MQSNSRSIFAIVYVFYLLMPKNVWYSIGLLNDKQFSILLLRYQAILGAENFPVTKKYYSLGQSTFPGLSLHAIVLPRNSGDSYRQRTVGKK